MLYQNMAMKNKITKMYLSPVLENWSEKGSDTLHYKGLQKKKRIYSNQVLGKEERSTFKSDWFICMTK